MTSRRAPQKHSSSCSEWKTPRKASMIEVIFIIVKKVIFIIVNSFQYVLFCKRFSRTLLIMFDHSLKISRKCFNLVVTKDHTYLHKPSTKISRFVCPFVNTSNKGLKNPTRWVSLAFALHTLKKVYQNSCSVNFGRVPRKGFVTLAFSA